MTRVIRIGTRGSKLALAQTGIVADTLRATGAEVELVTVTTPGDLSSAPISQIGVGVFTSALREALLRNEIDVAVHSYKDLPTAPEDGLVLAAVPPREDPRDALIARDGLTLGELPPGAKVGTGAARRMAQLRALGLGLEIVPIRGNIDTRMRKVTDGELDAVVLARAGLARVGRVDEITETLDPIQMLPAPAQGALALECRAADVDVEHLLASAADDESTRVAVTAERALLAALEAGCSAPVGALAEIVEDLDDEGAVVERISLRGTAAVEGENGGVDMVRASAIAGIGEAEKLGRELAAELLDLGAGELLGPAL
ncbi:hydroxymethylbilane synthase [Amycolatopsis rubida]|uniref:Porphobilinogen deaminase n=1 Tax=Amycolatopsis rubida TaxID=112413 RepID=A0A1I5DKM1_9PSEU|nr:MULTISPECIES: hydroxymethylbilane synthase [Amycolatopsis]NEC59086.1 hydroxymethylbilane synthase [Amycolatopsis rubida]OAP22028.1 Porphobilinogen deaminase [Amycolatopsis sp. M39]SFN99825.1 hydroxymethylbilane synthase [Amycolatopsis rubida]